MLPSRSLEFPLDMIGRDVGVTIVEEDCGICVTGAVEADDVEPG